MVAAATGVGGVGGAPWAPGIAPGHWTHTGCHLSPRRKQTRRKQSNSVATSHMWPLQFKFIKIKIENSLPQSH